jgi:putative aldouronate transport system substrate-binding protein
MKKERVFILFVMFLILGSLVYAGGGGQRASGGAVPEAAAPKFYQSGFTPSGTAASDYKAKLDYLAANFIKYFTDRGEADKIKGYDTPIKVTTALIDSAGMQTSFAAWKGLHGESAQMNRYLDAYKQAYNIDVSYKFASTEYTQQLRLNMAAGDLPDIFSVQNRQDLYEMAQAGVIQDLGGLRAKYSSKAVETMWEGSPLVDMATFDGKLYGLPQTWPATDPLSYLWIRADWLQALNLQVPKTFDELVRVIDAFTNADFDKNGVKDTIGIAFGKNVVFLNRGLFTGFGAYPDFWVSKNGSVIWGGVDENNKKALAFMNDLYKRGYVDREFVSYTDSDMLEAFMNGKCGVFYSPHWYISNVIELSTRDRGADLWAIPLPTADGKPAVSPLSPSSVGYTVVNSKFANPEIAYKMFSLFAFCYEGRDGSWWGFNPPSGGSNANDMSAFARVYSPWLNYDAYESLRKSYEAGWDRSLINAAADLYWGPMQNPDTKWGWDRLSSPELPNPAFKRLKEIVDAKTYFYDAYTGLPSTYMQDRWQAIQDEQLVTFTKIITGDLDVNAGFDAWVRTFNSMGGERITQEVNAWYKSH